MINRRFFLIAMAVQPLLLNRFFAQFPEKAFFPSIKEDEVEFLIVGGWVLIKSDLLHHES